ncbi:MAG: hypothetical protein BEN19_00045 [Epulopiscium sp. Nuni2H_MBin003]|nr:MAG: hypothetical protein BEN19_00045 [Epulopiscium sp. Nuni2H_MBin003]
MNELPRLNYEKPNTNYLLLLALGFLVYSYYQSTNGQMIYTNTYSNMYPDNMKFVLLGMAVIYILYQNDYI